MYADGEFLRELTPNSAAAAVRNWSWPFPRPGAGSAAPQDRFELTAVFLGETTDRFCDFGCKRILAKALLEDPSRLAAKGTHR